MLKGKASTDLPFYIRFYVITLGLLLFNLNLFSQSVEVSGRVVDPSGLAVPFASVVFTNTTAPGQTYGTLGLEDGQFSVLLKKDSYRIEISVVGLVSNHFDYDLSDTGDTFDLGELVVESETKLEEVTVRNTSSAIKLGLDKKEYDVTKDLLSKGGTLQDVMQNVPSVQVEGDGSLSLRGNPNVLILLDGKPSGFASSAEFLRSIPSSSIAKVEVITNPSAKYTAEGDAGIINIILKKGKQRRLNGSAELFTGYRLNLGANVNLNGNTKNGNWYSNTGIGYAEPLGKSRISLTNFQTDPDSTQQTTERLRRQLYFLLNIGGSTNLDEHQTLSGSITYRPVNANNENTTTYRDFNERALTSIIRRDEEENQKGNFFQGRTDYTLQLDTLGQKIDLGFSGEFARNRDDAQIQDRSLFPQEENNSLDNVLTNEHRRQWLLSADYVLPLQHKSTLEVGYLATLSSTKNDFEVNSDTGTGFFNIPEFTNNTEYRENVHAFYMQYAKSWEVFSYKIGLRTEVTDIDITADAANFKERKDYTDFFPSAFLNYTPNDLGAYSLSFSRRIGRPYYKLVVPSSSYTD